MICWFHRVKAWSRKLDWESLRGIITIALFLGGLVNVEPSAHGQGGPISSQTQNRQGFGPWGSNIPNDVNAGHPQRPPRPVWYMNPTNNLAHISPSNIAGPNTTTLGLPLTPGLTDEPERELPEVVLATDKTIETLTGGHTGTIWLTWVYACVLASGGILAFYRRKTGLTFVGVGAVLLGSSFLFKSDVPSATNNSPQPAKFTLVIELSKSAHPIPDFETFKERIASPYAFYRQQAAQAAPRLGRKTVPYLIKAEFDDRSSEVKRLARHSLLSMRDKSKAAWIWSRFNEGKEQMPIWAYEQLRSPKLNLDEDEAIANRLLADLLVRGHVKDEINRRLFRSVLFYHKDIHGSWDQHLESNKELEDDLFQGRIDKRQFLRAVTDRFVDSAVASFDSSTNPDSKSLLKFSQTAIFFSGITLTQDNLDRLKRVWTLQFEKEWYFCPYVRESEFTGRFDSSHLITIAKVFAASGKEGEEFLANELPKLGNAPFTVRCDVARIFAWSLSTKIRDSAKSIVQRSLHEIRTVLNNSNWDSDSTRKEHDSLLMSLAALGEKDALSKVLAIVENSSDVEFQKFSDSMFMMRNMRWLPPDQQSILRIAGPDEFWETSEVGFLAAKRMMLQEAKEKKAGASGILCIHPKLQENAEELYAKYFFQKSQSVEERLRSAVEILILQRDSGAKLDAPRFARAAIDDLLKQLPADGGQRQAIVERVIFEQLSLHLEPYLIAALNESTCPRSREALLSMFFGARHSLGDELGPPVARQTGSRHPAVQRAAFLVLQTLSTYDAATFAVLVNGVKNPDPIIRTTAMRALCRFQDRAALVLDEVTTRLKSDFAEEKLAAGQLLASMGPAAAPAISSLQLLPEFAQVTEAVRRNCTKE